METAIKKAIEGGYAIQRSYYARPVSFMALKSVNDHFAVFEIDDTTVIEDGTGAEITVPVTSSHQTSQVLLDPLFWQSLAKAEGWDGYQCLGCGYRHFSQIGFSECCQHWISAKTQERWKYEWHRFVDHLAEGKPIDVFFNHLIK